MLPSTGISSSLVANELGISAHNWSALCTNGNINMWSRWKPIDTSVAQINEQALSQVRYGLDYPQTANINTTISSFDGNTNGWIYTKPKGGIYSPYRIGDFRNYNHTAFPTIRSFSNSSTAVSKDPTGVVGGNIVVNTDINSVRLQDIPELQNYYFGIIVENGGNIKYGTSPTTIGSELSGSIAQVNIYQFPNGIANVYPILCKVPFSNTSSGNPSGPSNQSFVPVPGTRIGTVSIKESWVTIFLEAVATADGIVAWTCNIAVGAGGSTVTFNNNFAWLRFSKNEINDPIQQGEKRSKITDFYLNPGQEKEFTGTFSGTPMVSYTFWVTLSNATYTKSIGVIIPMF